MSTIKNYRNWKKDQITKDLKNIVNTAETIFINCPEMRPFVKGILDSAQNIARVYGGLNGNKLADEIMNTTKWRELYEAMGKAFSSGLVDGLMNYANSLNPVNTQISQWAASQINTSEAMNKIEAQKSKSIEEQRIHNPFGNTKNFIKNMADLGEEKYINEKENISNEEGNR